MRVSFLALGAALAAAKPVEVTLDAPWYPVSEPVLALETIAKYNTSSFYPLLSLLINERMKPDGREDEVEYLLDIAGRAGFLSAGSQKLALNEFNLGAALPNVESHYQMFESLVAEDAAMAECPVVMWTEGKVTCDLLELFALQAPATPMEPLLRLDDRVIGNGDQWLVVYADVDSPDFPEWHESLLEMALSGRVSYILRHRPATTATSVKSRGVSLAGYGASVTLKNTDYLVIDDRDNEGEQLQLDTSSKIDANMLPWIGYGLARRVRNLADATDLNKLDALEQLSFDLPYYAPLIAAEIDEVTIGDEVGMQLIGDPGFNAAVLDGVELKDADLFTFWAHLHKEITTLNELEYVLPAGHNIPDLLTSGVVHEGDVYEDPAAGATTDEEAKAAEAAAAQEKFKRAHRYDLSAAGNAIGWVNDVERDPFYAALGDDLAAVRETSDESPLAAVRRNIHNTVVVGDLTDRNMLAIVWTVMQQLGQDRPMQFGIVAPNPEWHDVRALGPQARQVFVMRLLNGDTPARAAATAKKAAEDAAADAAEDERAAAMVAAAAAEKKPSKEAVADFTERFGLDAVDGPSVFVNGFAASSDAWMELAKTVFEADAAYLRRVPDLESLGSLRDALFATGYAQRSEALDPLSERYIKWPTNSPMQVFHNDNVTTTTSSGSTGGHLHSVVFSSSFTSPESFALAEALLERATERGDVDLIVRPLLGIDARFYATLFDSTYNMFRFSLDLFRAARGHLFEHKTEPRVFTVVQPPAFSVEQLPNEPEVLIVDGRELRLDVLDVEPAHLDLILDRETPRLERLDAKVPGISGVGVAMLTAMSIDRTIITAHDVADINVPADAAINMTLALFVDPASAEGQQYLGLARSARAAGVGVKLFLTPTDVGEAPGRFFRPVLDRHVPAVFDKLDDDVLYTAAVVEPAAWLTVAKDTEHDLDNILLNRVPGSELAVTYELRSLLVRGMSLDTTASGAVLDLRANNGTKIADTSVMANVGYFQLQAPIPGLYDVCVSVDSTAAVNKAASFVLAADQTSDCVPVAVTDFSGPAVRSPIVKRAPKVVKYKKSKSKSSWSWGKDPKGDESAVSKPAEINIFTIASGHLYERFASIMMLSVMAHTKHSVKFWLVENFMSPKFKQVLPKLAAEHGFTYELVSYKWPHFLHPQTEKQREIWGYKMLFLDTLFPQDLDNVIFVDSDQIVRTDFKELLDMDLGDAPYAFTPMGDDRSEMEPYRFWKQGFWKEILGDKGLDYHISALYRVDLAKLREKRVGDILRMHYERLSQNPQNLANLDQDLPNSLQSLIPIHSLSRDWLWCETWCSDKSLATARTIDLCNNPLTKEPKLDRARRQAPEWVKYDNIVAEIYKSVGSASDAEVVEDVSDDGSHTNDHTFEEEYTHQDL